jgi:hypothetical protein
MTTTPPEELYLVFTNTKPFIETYDVKSTVKTDFLNEKFVFNVIGSSHFIFSDERPFYELVSCEQPQSHEIKQIITLSENTHKEGRYTIEDITAEITIETHPLAEAPTPRTQQIAYKFDENAYTMIDIISPTTYETYHTYPELDLAVFSQTTVVEQ